MNNTSKFVRVTIISQGMLQLCLESPTLACTTVQHLLSDLGLRTVQRDYSGSSRYPDGPGQVSSPELPMTAYTAVQHPHSDLGSGTEQQDCLANSRHQDDRGQALFPGLPVTSYAIVQNPYSDLEL